MPGWRDCQISADPCILLLDRRNGMRYNDSAGDKGRRGNPVHANGVRRLPMAR
jgi:hypothetical protein